MDANRKRQGSVGPAEAIGVTGGEITDQQFINSRDFEREKE